MPQISELFVSLGVKGSEKTLSAFSGVKDGLTGIKTTSFETKAAIAGVVYALEKLTIGSAQRGANLEILANYLNIGTVALQKWQYAANQANVSNEEFNQSLTSVYQKISQIRRGGETPQGFYEFSRAVGGFDLKRAYNDITYALTKINQYVKSHPNDDMINKFIETELGYTPGMIYAAQQGVFDKYVANAPHYTGRETKSLANVEVDWTNFKNKVSMFFGKFTAQHGDTLIKNLSKLSDQLFRLANSLEKLLENARVFELLQKLFDFMIKMVDSLNTYVEKNGVKIENQLGEKISNGTEEAVSVFTLKGFSKALKGIKDTLSTEEYPINDIPSFNERNDILSRYGLRNPNAVPFLKLMKENPVNVPSRFNLPSQAANTNNFNQNLYFQHPGEDYAMIQDSLVQGIKLATNQMSANVRVT